MKPKMTKPVFLVWTDQCEAAPKAAARIWWNQSKEAESCFIAKNDISMARGNPPSPLRPIILMDVPYIIKIQPTSREILDPQENRSLVRLRRRCMWPIVNSGNDMPNRINMPSYRHQP